MLKEWIWQTIATKITRYVAFAYCCVLCVFDLEHGFSGASCEVAEFNRDLTQLVAVMSLLSIQVSGI